MNNKNKCNTNTPPDAIPSEVEQLFKKTKRRKVVSTFLYVHSALHNRDIIKRSN